MAESMLLDTLTTYYRGQGILSTHFTCPHKAECEGDCKTFTGPKSAFVSTGYERHDVPRLLFLSLDSGSGTSDDRERLPKAVRRQEEVDFDLRSATKRDRRKHWYRTHELAWHILQRFDSKIRLEDAKKYFAHANSAKCSQNKPLGGQADRTLFNNCGKYLPGELEVLTPDIFVTQGARARDVGRRHQEIERLDEWAKIIVMNDREVFWLHTHHPSYGWLDRQFAGRPAWQAEYADMIHRFAESQGWPGT